MKAVRMHKYGGADVLSYDEVPTPEPGENEVLVKVLAAGVNYADTMRRNNDPYPEEAPLPFTLGADVAGTVEKLGPGVAGPAIGTSVFATPGRGGYAQYVLVPAAQVVPLPPGIEPAVATALMVQGLTASLLIHESGQLKAGESVLIQAAAGGVGSIAVQLAKILGAKVIAAVSSDEKRRLVYKLGADVVVDYNKPGWTDQVKLSTNGKGVDLVLEMTGGPVFSESLSCLAPFGRSIVYGIASRKQITLNPQELIVANQSVTGFYINGYFGLPGVVPRTLENLIGLVLANKLEVQVGLRLPLSEAKQAHELLETRKTVGKIVLEPWPA